MRSLTKLSTLKRFSVLLITGLMLVASGCGMFKDTKLEELYHDVTARYNGYFNARMLTQEVVEEVRKTHQDDFNEILSVYQFPSKEKAKQLTPKCDKIIEKCTRVLQKHEESKWSDNCYFLMGKARFYKGQHSKAIQMFRYVSSKYKERPTASRSKVWVVKTYLKQGNLTDARAMLTNIQSQDQFPQDLQYKLNLTKAAVAIQEGSYESARKQLRTALPAVSNNDLEYRYRFIMAQLSQEMDAYRKAIKTYNEVLSKRTRYELAFHSKINKAACYKERADEAPRKIDKVQADLRQMLKDDKNVDYKSRIYFELAQLARETGDTERFLSYLSEALKAQQASPEQKATAYRALANYHYNQDHYPKAKAYYDSTFQFISEDADNYLALKRKKDVLDELIEQKQTIRLQDSLQQMAQMPKQALKKQFQQVIANAEQEKQNRKAQQNRRQQFQQRRLRNQRMDQQQQFQGSEIGGSGSGSWYFYNEASKGRGLPQFKKKWGNRPLQDFWRTRTEKRVSANQETAPDTAEQSASKADTNRQRLAAEDMLKKEKIPDNFKKLPAEQQRFYAQMPLNKRQKRLSRKKQTRARFELGRIYYQDLKAYRLASNTLETLNEDEPDHANKPASLYYLYRIHDETDTTGKADTFKQQLIDQYPESEYARILQQAGGQGAGLQASKNNEELEKYYSKTYKAYQQARCKTVRKRQQRADSLFEDNYLAGKLAYLAILCEGKHRDTKKAFKQKLKTFIRERKGKPIASHAQNIYNYLQNDGELSAGSADRFPFEERPSKKHYYFLIINLQEQQSTKVVQNLADYNKKYYKFLNLDVSTLMYGRAKQALAVREFEDKGQAMRYLKSLANDDDFLKSINIETPNHFVATPDNYKKVMKEELLPKYAKFFKEKYKQNTP